MSNKVLIVEDNKIAQRIAQQVIKSCGDESVTVETGIEALRCAAEENYDLIILDIALPDVDGYTVRETLRGQGIKTPITGLTAHIDIAEEHIYSKPLTRKLYQNMLLNAQQHRAS